MTGMTHWWVNGRVLGQQNNTACDNLDDIDTATIIVDRVDCEACLLIRDGAR